MGFSQHSEHTSQLQGGPSTCLLNILQSAQIAGYIALEASSSRPYCDGPESVRRQVMQLAGNAQSFNFNGSPRTPFHQFLLVSAPLPTRPPAGPGNDRHGGQRNNYDSCACLLGTGMSCC